MIMPRLALWAVLLTSLSTCLSAGEEDIKLMLEKYVTAFNDADAESLTTLWAKNGVYTNQDTGERTEGRDAIIADLKAAMEAGGKLSGELTAFRQISDNAAQIEGEATVALPDLDPVRSRFLGIVVMQDNAWKIASMNEMGIAPPASPQEALSDLSELIGSWVDESGDGKITTTFRWSQSGAFLLRSYAVETEEGIAREGTQVIGWDPRANHIRSWNFNSDGSFGDGVWSKNGNSWFVQSTQTLSGGAAASGTFVITVVSDNELSCKLIGHEIEGEPQPASELVTLVKLQEAAPEQVDSTESANPSGK